jgi:hypothetical protein
MALKNEFKIDGEKLKIIFSMSYQYVIIKKKKALSFLNIAALSF